MQHCFGRSVVCRHHTKSECKAEEEDNLEKDYKAHNAMRAKSVVDHFERVMKQRRYFRFCSRWHMTIAKYSSTLKMKTGTENKGDISWVSVRPFENRRCNPFRDSVYWLKLASTSASILRGACKARRSSTLFLRLGAERIWFNKRGF